MTLRKCQSTARDPSSIPCLLLPPLENRSPRSRRAITKKLLRPPTDLVTSARSGRKRVDQTPSGAQTAAPGGPTPPVPFFLSRPPPPGAGPPPGPRAGGPTPPPGAAGSRAGTAASPAPPTRVPARGGGTSAAPLRTPAPGSPLTGGRCQSPGTAGGDADAPSSLGFGREGEKKGEGERERERERERKRKRKRERRETWTTCTF